MDVENSKASFDSSFCTVEDAKQRLGVWKKRQRSRRNVILQHLASMMYLNWEEYSQSFPDDWQEMIHSKMMNLLGPSRCIRTRFDETVHRKRAVLPVISRLRAPSISAKLSRRIELILARKFGLTNDGLTEPLFPSKDLRALSSRWNANCLNKSVLDTHSEVNSTNHMTDTHVKPDEGEKREGEEFMVKTYTGSATFLKGTQSANPHNDYCQHFVDTGERPQNFIRDTGLRNRFEEYPKLRELIRLKDALIQSRATPPMYLRADLKTFDLNELQSKFDVVLIEPPLEEYHRRNGAVFDQHWTWDEIEQLEIEKIISPRSFVWIWCGSGEGLDAARRCLRKWGFRRCEDICWIKTNRGRPGHEALEPGAVFQRTKEHCLMGIHGTVRRSTDGDFIHANIDIDLIIEEAPKHGGYAAKDKPTEIFHIIEHFCLGRRRLHLFGRDSTLRAGWLTVGNELSASNFDARLYASNFAKEPTGLLLGSTDEIERLRPKSPVPRHQNATGSNQSTGGGGGAVAGGGSGVAGAAPGTNSDQITMPIGNFSSGSGPNSGQGLNLTSSTLHHAMSLATSGLGASGSGPTLMSNTSSGTGLRSLISSGIGSHRRQGQSTSVKSTGLQPSLLGLPSSLSGPGLTGSARNPTNTRERNRNSHQNLPSFLNPANSSRGLSAFHTVNNAPTQSVPSLITPSSGVWPVSNNLAMALAGVSSSNVICPPVSSSSSSSISSTGSPTFSNPLFRGSFPDVSLLSSLLAAGKLSPALLAALSTAGGNAVGSTFGLGDLSRVLGNHPPPSGSHSRQHHHSAWR